MILALNDALMGLSRTLIELTFALENNLPVVFIGFISSL